MLPFVLLLKRLIKRCASDSLHVYLKDMPLTSEECKFQRHFNDLPAIVVRPLLQGRYILSALIFLNSGITYLFLMVIILRIRLIFAEYFGKQPYHGVFTMLNVTRRY